MIDPFEHIEHEIELLFSNNGIPFAWEDHRLERVGDSTVTQAAIQPADPYRESWRQFSLGN